LAAQIALRMSQECVSLEVNGVLEFVDAGHIAAANVA